MDHFHSSHLGSDRSVISSLPRRLSPLPRGGVEVYPPVVERGASVTLRTCRWHPPRPPSPLWRMSWRAWAVVLDVAKMVERQLTPEQVLEHQKLSSAFMCGSAKVQA